MHALEPQIKKETSQNKLILPNIISLVNVKLILGELPISSTMEVEW